MVSLTFDGLCERWGNLIAAKLIDAAHSITWQGGTCYYHYTARVARRLTVESAAKRLSCLAEESP